MRGQSSKTFYLFAGIFLVIQGCGDDQPEPRKVSPNKIVPSRTKSATSSSSSNYNINPIAVPYGTHLIKAVAQDGAGSSSTSAGMSVTCTTTTITLAWDPENDPNLIAYKMYWGTASRTYTNSALVPLGTNTNPSYQVTGLQPGTTYYFAVTAVAYSGINLESDYSNEASGTTISK